MTGVLADFVDVMHALGYSDDAVKRRAASIMQSYTPAQLPVLNQLARHYAVGDAWFASVPSQTNPNRAFAMCGTSGGLVDNGELEHDKRADAIEKQLGMRIGDDRFPDRTIFNAMHDAGCDWMVFWQTSYLPQKISKLIAIADSIPFSTNPIVDAIIIALKALLEALKPYSNYLIELSSGELSSNYTWRLFPTIQQIPNAAAHFNKIEQFHALARAGNLPAFSYIEPFWTISQTGTDTGLKRVLTAIGNDYHPPSNVLIGEEFVKQVYESLIADREAWSKTALLITFDEFVGSFDHVGPPSTVPPWGQGGHPGHKSPTGFAFDRLGARVPTILVSPYVQKSSVFRSATDVAYDHTSIIATTLQWLGIGDQLTAFGQRAAQAPTFDTVLVLDQPRTDEKDPDLAFLHTSRNIGDFVRYGDVFALQYENGDFLGAFQQAPLSAAFPDVLHDFAVDLGLAAYFPTLGGTTAQAPLTFWCQNPEMHVDPGVPSHEDPTSPVPVYRHEILNPSGTNPDRYYYDTTLDGITGYSYGRIFFYAYTTEVPGTHAVYQHGNSNPSSKNDDRYYYDTNPHGQSGWQRGDVLAFYAYESQVLGTTPIYRHESLTTPDRYYYDTRYKGTNGWSDGLVIPFYAFPAYSDYPGPVWDTDRLWLVSKETGLVADNVLGAWANSHDCYWYDLYLDGDYADQQAWTVHKVASPGSPGPALRFGDRVHLINQSYNQGLSQDGKWITTSSGNGGAWTIQPFVA